MFLYVAKERADFSFTNAELEVIWALGQESAGNRIVHQPLSGLELATDNSDPQFYKLDELKYHGRHAFQRGHVNINFMGMTAFISFLAWAFVTQT